MTKKEKNKKKSRKPMQHKKRVPQPVETRASEALTVCWGVTLTILIVCNVIVIGSQLYVSWYPEAKRTAIFGDLLLLAGSMVGVFSLVLLPLLYRVRQIPPPNGVAVFGACLAIAPILGLLMKALGNS